MTKAAEDRDGLAVSDPEFDGAILSLHDGILTGWASYRADVAGAIEIEVWATPVNADVFVSETAIGRGEASEPASLEAGSAPGARGFRIMLDLPGQLAPPYEIGARVAGSSVALANSIRIETLDQHATMARAHSGEITRLDSGALEGWVVFKADLAVIVQAELWVDDLCLATCDANRPEPVSRDGLGHGFRLKLPDRLLDGLVHRARVLVKGTSYELKGSPFPLALLPMSVFSDRLDRIESAIDALLRSKEQASAVVEDMYLQVGRDLSQRLDAMICLQRDSFERELSALRILAGEPRRAEQEPDVAPSALMNADDGLVGYGWYLTERDQEGRPFRWMDRSATIVMDYRARSAARIVVDGYMAMDSSLLKSLSIAVNGIRALGSVTQGAEGWLYEGTVAAHAFRGSSFAIITFKTSGSHVPNHTDGRKLSVAIRSVSLENAVENA